jgi:hypothetical protein
MTAVIQDLFLSPLPAPSAQTEPGISCSDCTHYKRFAGGASCRACYWYIALPQGTEAHALGCKSFERKE